MPSVASLNKPVCAYVPSLYAPTHPKSGLALVCALAVPPETNEPVTVLAMVKVSEVVAVIVLLDKLNAVGLHPIIVTLIPVE